MDDKESVDTVAGVTDQELLPSETVGDVPSPELARPRRRWCWGTRLVLAATVAWSVFVAAHLSLSGRAWWWGPLDLVPPLVFVVVPVVLLVVAPLARPVRWRLLALVVVTGVLGAGSSGVNLAALWHSPPPAPPGALTVVSWNTEYWDQNWRTGTGQSLEAGFYRFLRELDADVYLLKEYIHIERVFPLRLSSVFAVDRVERLRAEFPDYHVAVAGKQITLSRLPIIWQEGLDMSAWLPADLRQVPPELAEFPEFHTETLRTDLLVDGVVVSFYNTHVFQPAVDPLLYRADTRDTTREAHHRRAASLAALRADVEANRYPVVVGADLNASPAMGLLRLLPDRLEDPAAATGSIYPTTWRAGGLELWRIDWLLTTSDVTVHEYDLVHPAGLSDHRVVRAQLSTG